MLIIMNILWKQYYYIDFRVKKTEAESACESHLSDSNFILIS